MKRVVIILLLLQAACCRDPAVAKTSVEILRSVISHVLQEQPEPRHFHFNEALFKPFEHLLCRQNCDPDLLDQVMSSLCELVECWSGEIRSGWRPLFACLCRWPPPAQEPLESCSSNQRIHAENIATVKEVLAAFVHQGASQPLVFANAAMDAILCQLHYLKSYSNIHEYFHLINLAIKIFFYGRIRSRVIWNSNRLFAAVCQIADPTVSCWKSNPTIPSSLFLCSELDFRWQ